MLFIIICELFNSFVYYLFISIHGVKSPLKGQCSNQTNKNYYCNIVGVGVAYTEERCCLLPLVVVCWGQKVTIVVVSSWKWTCVVSLMTYIERHCITDILRKLSNELLLLLVINCVWMYVCECVCGCARKYIWTCVWVREHSCSETDYTKELLSFYYITIFNKRVSC